MINKIIIKVSNTNENYDQKRRNFLSGCAFFVLLRQNMIDEWEEATHSYALWPKLITFHSHQLQSLTTAIITLLQVTNIHHVNHQCLSFVRDCFLVNKIYATFGTIIKFHLVNVILFRYCLNCTVDLCNTYSCQEVALHSRGAQVALD